MIREGIPEEGIIRLRSPECRKYPGFYHCLPHKVLKESQHP